jgi:nucleoside-diphosphate-sugar epimerase
MEIFVTGASGYIGRAVSGTLKAAGYEVLGLVRSAEAAAKLAAGVKPVSGDLASLDVLRDVARSAEATIHCGMQWGPDAGAADRAAVEAMLSALEGTDKPLLYTSGVWVMGDTKGRVAGEMFPLNPPPLVAWRPAVERLVQDARERKVCGVVIRPAMVYGNGGGMAHAMAEQAKQSGVIEVAGDGENHWSFVHVGDLASLYRLAMEKARAGSLYLAAHGNAVTVKSVAAAAAKAAGREVRIEYLPIEKAREKWGPLADCLVLDQRVLSTKAARELGWKPAANGVLQDLVLGRA